MNKPWYVYIVKCSDDTLYTGVTLDIERRLKQHNNGTGANYTKRRRPVVLMVMFESPNQSEACKEEYRIKQLTRKEKLLLIDGNRNTSTQ